MKRRGAQASLRWYYYPMSKQELTTQFSKQNQAADFRSYDAVIVGGGASGLTCAIACMQALQGRDSVQTDTSYSAQRNPRILILESGRRIGASIMRSGNGRCNFSHTNVDSASYYNASFVEQAFAAHATNERIPSVISWFEHLGLVWDEMPGSGGLLYPFSRKANSVLDVLRCALDEYGIEVQEGRRVEKIVQSDPSIWRISGMATECVTSKKEGNFRKKKGGKAIEKPSEPSPFEVCARNVVVASGGTTPQTLYQAGSVTYVSPHAVLGPLAAYTDGVSLQSLDGIRVQARITIPARSFSEEGEVLFRGYGISGIVVFNASRFAQAGDVLYLDLVPHIGEDALFDSLLKRAQLLKGRNPEEFLTGFVVAPLARALLEKISGSFARDFKLNQKHLRSLAALLKAFPMTIEGIADERACQVHRGGVQVSQVNPSTMELASLPRMYVLGEALDIDAPCGGYNLHWAWTTGLLAGYALADEFSKGLDQ